MKKQTIWIGIFSVLLGIVIAVQLKMIQDTYFDDGANTETFSEMSKELDTLLAEKKSLEAKLAELEIVLSEIEESAADENMVIKTMKSDIEKYKVFAGLTDVYGQGVIVTIDNPPEDSTQTFERNLIFDYRLIVELANELNAAGAEAISINGQRLVSTSEIRMAGNALMVNNIPLHAPFEIKAIGNKNTLEGALNQRFGIVSTLRDYGYLVDVKKLDYVEIPKYNGVIKFDYAETVSN